MSECSLPSKLLQWVDGWGRDLQRRVVAALAAAFAEVQGSRPTATVFLAQMSCILAQIAMGWKFRAFDCNAGIRDHLK